MLRLIGLISAVVVIAFVFLISPPATKVALAESCQAAEARAMAEINAIRARYARMEQSSCNAARQQVEICRKGIEFTEICREAQSQRQGYQTCVDQAQAIVRQLCN